MPLKKTLYLFYQSSDEDDMKTIFHSSRRRMCHDLIRDSIGLDPFNLPLNVIFLFSFFLLREVHIKSCKYKRILHTLQEVKRACLYLEFAFVFFSSIPNGWWSFRLPSRLTHWTPPPHKHTQPVNSSLVIFLCWSSKGYP